MKVPCFIAKTLEPLEMKIHSSKIRMYARDALEALLVLPQNIDNISLRQTDQNMHFSSPILNSFVAEKKHELIQLLVNATEKTNEAKKSRRDTASRIVRRM